MLAAGHRGNPYNPEKTKFGQKLVALLTRRAYTNSMKKIIISARRQNNQAVFFRGIADENEMTESQDLALDFKDKYLAPYFAAKEKTENLSSAYSGLLDWKVEEITC